MPETKEKLAALRKVLKDKGLAGFVVPLTDEHQSEYVPAYAERLAWLTGFTGSFGIAIILQDRAAVFTDGRYTLQIDRQVDGEAFERLHVQKTPPRGWLQAHAGEGDVIGYDPALHTTGWVKETDSALADRGAKLRAVDANPVDAVWDDQPGPPQGPAVPHAIEYAGEAHADKRARLGKAIGDKGADFAVITALDSIAWLFNIRGGDVPKTPVVLAYALLRTDGAAELFIHPAKVTDELKAHLGGGVKLQDRADFFAVLKDRAKGQIVLADPATASAAVFSAIEGRAKRIIRADDPCALPKAQKNEAERTGARAAHVRDGAALTRCLYWLKTEAPKGGISELDVVGRLLDLRGEDDLFRGPSFDTISGAGPDGAIIHYRVSEETNRKIENNSVFLVDSGGQYLDGTTDVTRTLAIGEAPEEAKEAFTRVLKGHIALALAEFPAGTTGPQLDTIARLPLWRAGLDYDHGTGHGVGSYLGVHEGPGRIAKTQNTVALKPGMIFSNEPGYYRPGAFGIRIENLVLVEERDSPGEQDMLGFETLTLAPIDRDMIVPEMLDGQEIAWLNAYHARVREALSPHLDGEVRDWLIAVTEKIPAAA